MSIKTFLITTADNDTDPEHGEEIGNTRSGTGAMAGNQERMKETKRDYQNSLFRSPQFLMESFELSDGTGRRCRWCGGSFRVSF